jgi:hypothetical protein
MHNRYEQYPGLYGTVVPVLEYHTLYDAYPGRVHCCCCVFTVYSLQYLRYVVDHNAVRRRGPREWDVPG